jgi:hypothetical protein
VPHGSETLGKPKKAVRTGPKRKRLMDDKPQFIRLIGVYERITEPNSGEPSRFFHEETKRRSRTMEPRECVRQIEVVALLPSGGGDRFAGYVVIGSFRSGHVLAFRRFPPSSLGPGYTSIWHRDPNGRWTFYSTVAPGRSCSFAWSRRTRMRGALSGAPCRRTRGALTNFGL